jgi:hypothetical protein
VCGEKYVVNINSESSDIKLSVFLYPDVGESTNILYSASGELSIPNNCVGIIIRLQVAKNTALVNKKITATITNAKTNKQIDALGLLTRGALDSGNLNDLSVNGVFLLAAGRSYTNAPFAAGWLVSIAYTAAIRAQIGYDFETGVMQYRQRTANGWKPWKILTPNGYASNPKYMAFGDSLTWGAIWTAGQGGTGHTVTRTDIQNQMPTRIANAIGSTAFTNNGVSGMAYVVNVSAGTAEMSILDKIKTIDLSSYDLVTIAGGRNDAYNSLGTRNSTSADGTVCGAIKELIEYMRTTYAFTQFVIIGCTPSATTNAEVWSKVYPGGWTLGEFDAEVGAICEAYNVPYIDWKSCNYMHHWASYTGVDGNYSHPNNDRAYLEMGNYLGGRVSQFFRG